MQQRTYLGREAEKYADSAVTRESQADQTLAIGEGLAAIAYSLLEVADAIRESTTATERGR
ncbi:hypothetical protein [Streptomyces malaysiensis]|uniref:Uncharacterized protein n=1 Tax=Streptomyces malaysiensis TaxID=92644 RepID=A0A7X5XAD1_STRMQ|nr:hypothetical protein [Streptomyces malaysiensis]NIY69514.1 hypothetical protein [Streptomyces malaysiensis]